MNDSSLNFCRLRSLFEKVNIVNKSRRLALRSPFEIETILGYPDFEVKEVNLSSPPVVQFRHRPERYHAPTWTDTMGEICVDLVGSICIKDPTVDPQSPHGISYICSWAYPLFPRSLGDNDERAISIFRQYLQDTTNPIHGWFLTTIQDILKKKENA